MAESNERIGVLLANTGSPDAPTPEAVKVYLKEFLSCSRIVPVNKVAWWFILRLFVLPKRSQASAAKYKKIWTPEGSPQLVHMAALAEALQASFDEANQPITIKWAMSFGNPSISKAMDEFRAEGINRLVVLPLYPQSAYSTAKVVEDAVRAYIKKSDWRPFVRYVNGYSDHQSYAKAIARSIMDAGFEPNSTDKLVFAFHSIPLADIEAGDTYELQVGSSCMAISNELDIPRSQWTLAFQCRFDKGREWLSPFTPDVLAREAELDKHRVFFVCPNFSMDNLETLYDVLAQYKTGYLTELEKNGVSTDEESFIYIPCLNSGELQVKVISDVIRSVAL